MVGDIGAVPGGGRRGAPEGRPQGTKWRGMDMAAKLWGGRTWRSSTEGLSWSRGERGRWFELDSDGEEEKVNPGRGQYSVGTIGNSMSSGARLPDRFFAAVDILDQLMRQAIRPSRRGTTATPHNSPAYKPRTPKP